MSRPELRNQLCPVCEQHRGLEYHLSEKTLRDNEADSWVYPAGCPACEADLLVWENGVCYPADSF